MQNSQGGVSSPGAIPVSKSRLLAVTGMFGALSILLTLVSQLFGLNFPIIPYLQFDFGEVAIVLALLLFGLWPAVAASIVEFLTLMAIGENVPYGPILKIIAILSSLAGLWLGMSVAAKTRKRPLKRFVLGSGLGLGVASRIAFMTLANYFLIVYVYTINGTVGLIEASFKLIGISISAANALTFILGFTALFNCLQLALVFGIAYFLVRLPQLRRSPRSNRLAWFESFAGRNME